MWEDQEAEAEEDALFRPCRNKEIRSTKLEARNKGKILITKAPKKMSFAEPAEKSEKTLSRYFRQD